MVKGAHTRQSRSTGSERVRASRDGDRFHYTWAATRLLQLLSPTSNLQQISIEGLGIAPWDEEPDGSEVIDLVEFYGPSGGVFTTLEVRQFKHSTLRPDENLTLSEIGEILNKFAELDESLRMRFPQAIVRFSVVTNKPISTEACEAVRELASGKPAEVGPSAARLRKSADLSADAAASLCSRLDLRAVSVELLL